jgi:hypothetical protein
MLDLLDDLLAAVLTPVSAEIDFVAPDETWRNTVTGTALNVYLVELRENRKLRSNARTQELVRNVVHEREVPLRLDCHYLLSAQSAAAASYEPMQEEHKLLYKGVQALARHSPLNPSRVYPAGSASLLAWDHLKGVDLPTTIAPPEGFHKLAEFWQGMGQGHRWRPTVYFIVTVPVSLESFVAGPLVTTRITVYAPTTSASGDTWIDIGGTLRDVGGSPVASASVALESTTSTPVQAGTSDARGRFRFGGLRPGDYQLRARAAGQGEVVGAITVPSTTGLYDLQFQ